MAWHGMGVYLGVYRVLAYGHMGYRVRVFRHMAIRGIGLGFQAYGHMGYRVRVFRHMAIRGIGL